MKFECKCGELVVDDESTNLYVGFRAESWNQGLDHLEEVFVSVGTGAEASENGVMRWLANLSVTPVWQCPSCNRIIVIERGEVSFWRRET